MTEVREVAVAVRDGPKVLLCRRPPDAARWADMWEVPHGEVDPGEPADAATVRVAKELTGLDVAPGPEVATVRHGVTRWAITLVCLEARRVGGRFRPGYYAAAEWTDPATLAGRPVSSPQRRLMAELARRGRQMRLF